MANTEEWNGVSWSEVADIPAGRIGLGGAAANNTAALAFGGNPGYSTDTNEWNVPSNVVKTLTD